MWTESLALSASHWLTTNLPPPPAITVANTMGVTGANVSLFCNVTVASSSPQDLIYTWTRSINGRRVFPAFLELSRTVGRDTDTLTILNVGVADETYDYKCIVSLSDEPLGSATGVLTIQGKLAHMHTHHTS